MISAIDFSRSDLFDHHDDNDYMDEITENCIILCEDDDLVRFLSKQVDDICHGKHESEDGYDYWVTNPDGELRTPQVSRRLQYLPSAIYVIDNTQRIMITVEACVVFCAERPEDIWFVIRTDENRVSLYPFKIFKGFQEEWRKGVLNVYEGVVSGKYSPYSYAKKCKVQIEIEE